MDILVPSVCVCEAHSSDIFCQCSPGPAALTPDWAYQDKNQLSLPHSVPHPKGRSPLWAYTAAWDSIKRERNHLALRPQLLEKQEWTNNDINSS